MKPLSSLLILLMVATLSTGSMFASTVLYNQPINQCCGDGGLYSNDPSQLAADLFNLAGGGTINQAVWYGAAYNGLSFGTFNVEFYDGTGGTPGAQLYIFTAAPTIVDTGMLDPYGLELYQFTMNIPAFTALAGANYFFSASDSGPFNFVWENSTLTSGGFFSDNGKFGPWNDLSGTVRASQAFTLLNAGTTPEPGTFVLLGSSLLGVAGVLRRKLSH